MLYLEVGNIEGKVESKEKEKEETEIANRMEPFPSLLSLQIGVVGGYVCLCAFVHFYTALNSFSHRLK